MSCIAWFAQYSAIKDDGSIGGDHQSMLCLWKSECAERFLFSKPLSQPFARALITLLESVFIDGKPVMLGKKIAGIDEEAIRAKLSSMESRIARAKSNVLQHP